MKGIVLHLKNLFFVCAIFFLLKPVFCQTPITITGELRSRVEGRDNADFNTERLDGTVFVQNRVRLSFSREWENGVDVFVQLQDSRIWGEEGSSVTAPGSVDLHQAYFDLENVAGLPVNVRLGRQELAFGSGRLVSHYSWHNVGRVFDAARIVIGRKDQSVNLWLAQVRDFNAPTIRRNQALGGAYFSTQKILPGGVDVYLLYFVDKRKFGASVAHDHDHGGPEEQEGTQNGNENLNVWSFSSRVKTKLLDRLDLEIEGAYQLGNRGALDVRAFGFAVESKYTLPANIKPAVLAGYTFGSGDSNPHDAKLATFSNLFPDVHTYLGNMDYVSWSNVSALYFGATVQPGRHFEIGAKAYFFALADDKDAFYRADGYRVGSPAEIYRSAVPDAGTDLGKEIDLYAKLRYRERIVATFGFSNFFVGEFLENTGGLRADDSSFGYFSVAVNF